MCLFSIFLFRLGCIVPGAPFPGQWPLPGALPRNDARRELAGSLRANNKKWGTPMQVQPISADMLVLANSFLQEASCLAVVQGLSKEGRSDGDEIYAASCRLAALWKALAWQRLEDLTERVDGSPYSVISQALWMAAATAPLDDASSIAEFEPGLLRSVALQFPPAS
jgi:hypothetical protein